MSIIRIAKRDNPYVQIDHRVLEDERLSWKAKGLLAYLLSKPRDWRVMSEDLVAKATDGRDAVKAAMRELRDAGYASLETPMANGAILGKCWVIREIPCNSLMDSKDGFSDDRGFPTVGKSATSNKETASKKEKATNKERVVEGLIEFKELWIPEFKEAWADWVADRKERRKPITERAAKAQLEKCKGWGSAKSIAIIRNAIEKGWQGLYESESNGTAPAKPYVPPKGIPAIPEYDPTTAFVPPELRKT